MQLFSSHVRFGVSIGKNNYTISNKQAGAVEHAQQTFLVISGISLTCSVGGYLFSLASKIFELNFFIRKNFPVDGQTSQARSFSQLINLPIAWPFMRAEYVNK